MTSGNRMLKKPRTWRIKIMVSNLGSQLLTRVLIITANKIAAQYNMTLCQGLGSYVGSVRIMRPCNMVPLRYPTDATNACHPRTVNHPAI